MERGDDFFQSCIHVLLRHRLKAASTGPVIASGLVAGDTMKKLSLLFASLYLAAMLGGISGARAHTAAACEKELKNYSKMCVFSPTAWLLGFCKNKKAIAWCSDKKMHAKKFH